MQKDERKAILPRARLHSSLSSSSLPTMAWIMRSRRSIVFELSFVFFFALLFVSARSLNIGVQVADSRISVGKGCSRTCESEFCSVAPFLRYGKYCGLLYSGCPGERPCDGLDACCMNHDACVQSKNNDYLSRDCSKGMLKCLAKLEKSRARSSTFHGNKCEVAKVVELISLVMDAALIAGKYLDDGP